jgi:hypothetical protein
VKRTRAAEIRRRRLATTVAAASALTVGIVLATQLPAHSHSRPPTSNSAGSPPSVAPSTAADATSNAGLLTLRKDIAAYLATRHGAASAAIYDRTAQKTVVVHPSLRGRTASIVKVDILETRLHQTGGDLSEEQRETATSMIENSDNDSATELWDDDGGPSGIKAYNDEVGLSQTTPNDDWGLTTTSAADQVALVRELFRHNKLLTTSGRNFQRRLMRHIESDQRWGISGGVPSSAIVGNKNGWLPVTEDHNLWAVNSIGWVKGDGKSYFIAVITQHDPSEDYGIDTIQHVARMVWNHATVAKSAS